MEIDHQQIALDHGREAVRALHQRVDCRIGDQMHARVRRGAEDGATATLLDIAAVRDVHDGVHVECQIIQKLRLLWELLRLEEGLHRAIDKHHHHVVLIGDIEDAVALGQPLGVVEALGVNAALAVLDANDGAIAVLTELTDLAHKDSAIAQDENGLWHAQIGDGGRRRIGGGSGGGASQDEGGEKVAGDAHGNSVIVRCDPWAGRRRF